MLDTIKTRVRNEIEALKENIQHNRELIEKRSRKTLDKIAADELEMKTLEADLKQLEELSAAKQQKQPQTA